MKQSVKMSKQNMLPAIAGSIYFYLLNLITSYPKINYLVGKAVNPKCALISLSLNLLATI